MPLPSGFHERPKLLPWRERWSEANFAKLTSLWNLSEDDQANMRTLRDNMKDINHWKNDPFEVIRYYKEHHQPRNPAAGLKKAEKMFRHMVQWRLDNDIDTMLQSIPEPDRHWAVNLPTQMLETTDYDDDPIFIDRIGAADSWGLLQHFGFKAFVDHVTWIRELQSHPQFWAQQQRNERQPVCQFNVIVDLEGLNLGHLRPGLLPVLDRTARITQDYYIGWEKRIIVIRAPAIFKYIWTLCRHFFDQRIQDALIFGTKHDYLEVLGQYMDLENLPPELAPQGKAKGYPCYFDRVSLEGGPFRTVQTDTSISKHREGEVLAATDSDRSVSSESFAEVTVKCTRLMKGTWNKYSIIIQ